MTVKELKNQLSQFPDEFNVYFSPDFWPDAGFSVDKVEESYAVDMDESPVIILTNNKWQLKNSKILSKIFQMKLK